MKDFNQVLAEMEAEDRQRAARRALINDGATGAIDISGPATAGAIADTSHPASQMQTWEQMSRTEQAMNALEGGYHGLKKSRTAAEIVDAYEAEKHGLSTFTDDIDGTDDESRKAVEALLNKDTQVNRQYKQEQFERMCDAAYEYRALMADDYKYRAPVDIQRMQEATKGKGLWEGLGIAAETLASGDAFGNAIYLAGTSFGAVAPYMAMAALGGGIAGIGGTTAVANAVRGALMAYGSYANEYGSFIAERLQEAGVDLSDPEAWRGALANQATIDDLKYRAANRATGVAFFDGIAGYAAGIRLNPAEAIRKLSRQVAAGKPQSLSSRLGGAMVNLGAQSTLQGVLGGAGEAVGSLAAGEEVNAGDVLMEMLGEFTSAPIEVVTTGASVTNQYRRGMEYQALAEAEQKLMTNIVNVSEASAMALGNEETVVKWGERLGKDKAVYAFAQDLVVNGQMEKLQETDPQLAEDIKKAAEEGTTVTIPVGKVVEISTKDKALAQEMIQDCRLSVDGMSPRQAEEFKKNGLEEATKQFDKALKNSKATVQQFQSAHKVAQRLKSELTAAGTDSSVAAAQVKPLEMHLARLAGQLGIDPEKIAEELNLRVEKNGKGVNDIAFESRLSPSITGKDAIKKGLAKDSRFSYQPPSLERMMEDPEQFETNLGFMKQAAGMKGAVGRLRKPEKISEAIINRMVENLLWIHDKMNPATRNRAKLWYDGAHRAAVAWATRYGLHVRQTAAAIAIFSPQTNWFNNMSCAERTMDMIFGQRETKANDAMLPLLERYCSGKDSFRLEALKTKTLGELIEAGDLRTVAIWCKAFDTANTDPRIRVQTPEGGVGDWYTGKRVWLGVDRQAAAISVLLNGTVDNIDLQIGGEFKVRDFYNNIFDPTNPDAATIDTHAVGANLFSVMSGKDVDVKANFGTQKGTVTSSQTGQSGTYAFHYEALKRAAAKRGLLPREMQSITWEGVRALFGEKQKKALRPKVQAIWARHDAGEITAEQARNEIFELAGGFNPISWDNEQTPYSEVVTDSYERSNVKLPKLKPAPLDPTLAIEAAPNPDDEVAVAQWDKLNDTEKYEVTKAVTEDVMAMVSEYLKARTGEYGLQVGGWLGDVNYSMSAKVYDPDRACEVAGLVARLLRQQAVMVLSATEGKGMFKSGVIQIRLPEGFTPKQIEHLYKEGIDKAGEGRLVNGMSAANGIMSIVLDEGMDGAKIVEAIRKRLKSEDFASHGFEVFYEDAFAAFVTPTEYQNDSNRTQDASRLGASAGNDSISSLQKSTDTLFAAHIARATASRGFQQSGRNDFRSNGTLSERTSGQDGSRGQGSPIKRYGQPREGSVSVVGVHYSGESRSMLDTDHYGTGMKGAEARRLAGAPDLKQRLYFYVDEGNGIKPESGVGAYKHAVNLNNIYDASADPLDIVRNARKQAVAEGALYTADIDERQNYVERAIRDAGFDGYYQRGAQGNQGVVCLIGKHNVEVEEYGAENQVATQAAAPKSAIKKRYMLSPSEWSLVPALRVLAKALNTQYGADTVFVGSDSITFSETVADDIAKLLPRSATNSFQQRAYHGSPHEFDRFSLEHIGSGEGAQAHGWGLYFTEDMAVAERYRNSLAGGEVRFKGQSITKLHRKLEDAREYGKLAIIEELMLKQSIYEMRIDAPSQIREEFYSQADWDWFESEVVPYIERDGRVFKVEIPETDEMLDEQKYFEDQSDYVQDRLKDAWAEIEYDYELEDLTGAEIYQAFVEHYGSPKEASLAMNEHGIEGITYDGSRDGRCYVVFDDKAVEILEYWQNQEKSRGSYVPTNTATNTSGIAGLVTLMENADKSTFMHESAHFFLDLDTLLAGRIADKYARGEELTDGEKEFLTNLGGFFQWGQREGVINLGVTDDLESVMRAARQWSSLSMNQQRAMHELFAEGFESYLMTGQAPSNAVRSLFDRFKEWLMDVYATATKKPRPISKEVQKLYSLMFATQQEVADVDAANGMIPLFDLEDQREEEAAKMKGVKLTKEERAAFRKLHKEAQLEAQGIISKAVSGVVGYYIKLRDSAAKKIAKEEKKRVDARIEALKEEPRYIAFDILTNGMTRDGKMLRFKLSAESLRAEGYSPETIEALQAKGFVYDGDKRRKQLSPKKLAEMSGAEDWEQLINDLAEGTKAGRKSALAKAREFLGWSDGYKLSVIELKAAGVKPETIAKLIDRDIAFDSSIKSNTIDSAALAEMCGHDSAVQLISELVDIEEPRTEAASQIAAEIQMETGVQPEVYNELQANLAAHNKSRSRFLHAEYNALARELGSRQLAIYAAREYAQKKIKSLRLGDVSASGYIAAERRCARDAERAYLKGDFQACLDAKRGQILNHEMARAALEVEERYEKARRAAKRTVKFKTLYKPYQRLIAKMVTVNDLYKAPEKMLKADEKFSEVLNELVEEGVFSQEDVNAISDYLTNPKSVDDMTVEEANDFFATVQMLTGIARARQRQNIAEMQGRIDDIVEEGSERLTEVAAKQGTKPVNETIHSGWGKKMQWAREKFYDHIKASTLCRIFDQNKENGFFWNLFIRSANECTNFENDERAKATQKLTDILTPVFGKKGAFDQDKQRIGNKMMSKGERFAAACNMGNESNMQRLIDGDRAQWTPENIEALQNSLTAAEWQAVQAVWDLLESYRPMIAEKQKRIYGDEPQWIEPKELQVQTADNQVITLRGGYYPVKYDPKASKKAKQQEEAKSAQEMFRGAFQASTTNQSFMKSRVAKVNDRPLLLNLSGLFSGVTDVIHDLAWHEWLIETGRVLNGVHGEGSGLGKVIKEKYGDEVLTVFDNWRQDIALGDRVQADWWAGGGLSGHVGLALMGWSATSALVQLTGIGYIVPRCGAVNTLRALRNCVSHPIEARKLVNELSPMMKNRALTSNRLISEIRNQVDSGKTPWYKRYAYSALIAVQSLVDTICWHAAYEKAKRDPKVLNALDPVATAVAIADQAVIDTQSSGNVADMSHIENNANARILTVFYSWANAALNQSYAIAKGEEDRAARMSKLLWMGVMMPVVEQLFREALKAEDDDEDEELDFFKMMRLPLGASIEYHLGLVVGLREIANAGGNLIKGEPIFGYGGPAGTRGIGAVTSAMQQAANLDLEDPFTWSGVSAAVNVAGAFTGIPSAQINRTIKGIRAIESGQAEGMDALLAPVFGFSGRIKD